MSAKIKLKEEEDILLPKMEKVLECALEVIRNNPLSDVFDYEHKDTIFDNIWLETSVNNKYLEEWRKLSGIDDLIVKVIGTTGNSDDHIHYHMETHELLAPLGQSENFPDYTEGVFYLNKINPDPIEKGMTYVIPAKTVHGFGTRKKGDKIYFLSVQNKDSANDHKIVKPKRK